MKKQDKGPEVVEVFEWSLDVVEVWACKLL
jgi:hypothetical protein